MFKQAKKTVQEINQGAHTLAELLSLTFFFAKIYLQFFLSSNEIPYDME